MIATELPPWPCEAAWNILRRTSVKQRTLEPTLTFIHNEWRNYG